MEGVIGLLGTMILYTIIDWLFIKKQKPGSNIVKMNYRPKYQPRRNYQSEQNLIDIRASEKIKWLLQEWKKMS